MNTKLDDIFYSGEMEKVRVSAEDSASELETSSLLAKSSVPYSHRRIAGKFVILKQICKFQIVQPRISLTEENLLKKYHFKTLENTTISTANKELAQLKEWATSTDDTLRNDSTKLLNIRIKELKFMLSYNYTKSSEEMYNGYKAVDTYLTGVTKYYN